MSIRCIITLLPHTLAYVEKYLQYLRITGYNNITMYMYLSGK